DREVNLHLVQPTGMDRRVNQNGPGVRFGQAADRSLPSMGRAVINDPEDTLPGAIRLLLHDLTDQPPEGVDAGLELAAPHDVTTPDVPGRQVLQGPAPFVLGLDAQGALRGGPQAGVAADAGLNAGLLVGTDDVVFRTQGLAAPQARIQVQDRAGFLGELRGAWENPVLVLAGLEGVGMQGAPDRAAADGLAESGVGPGRQVGERLAA